MKYIMLRRDDQDVPIIFPDFLNHIDVAATVTQQLALSRAKVVSAGSCDIYCTNTYGKSTTLEIDSDESDANIISTYDYNRGIVSPTATIVALVREAFRRALAEL